MLAKADVHTHVKGSKLDLDGKGLTSIAPDAFEGLSKITVVDFSNNQLKELPEGLFKGMESLQFIYMHHNQLTTFPAGLLQGLNSLQAIFVHNNQLSELPEKLFQGLPNIQELGLSNNLLTALPQGLFQGLQNVQRLWLHNHRLTAIPQGIFQGLTNVKEIYLDGNKFTEIPEGLFQGLSNLGRIGLSNNRLTSLPQGLFQGLKSLERVYLSNNQLTGVPEGLFAGLQYVSEIYLDSNKIAAVPEGIFKGLNKLQRIYLHHNQLTELPEGLFQGLQSIQYLYIHHNLFNTLPEGLFRGLQSLEFIYLHNNKLVSIPEGLFQGLQKLQEIGLSNNLLTAIPEKVFQGLPSLLRIFLHYHRITAVPKGLFQGLPNVQEIYLDGNKLHEVPEDLFNGLRTLQIIGLSHNKLIEIPELLFQGLENLQTVHLSGNKIRRLAKETFWELPVLTSLEVDSSFDSAHLLAEKTNKRTAHERSEQKFSEASNVEEKSVQPKLDGPQSVPNPEGDIVKDSVSIIQQASFVLQRRALEMESEQRSQVLESLWQNASSLPSVVLEFERATAELNGVVVRLSETLASGLSIESDGLETLKKAVLQRNEEAKSLSSAVEQANILESREKAVEEAKSILEQEAAHLSRCSKLLKDTLAEVTESKDTEQLINVEASQVQDAINTVKELLQALSSRESGILAKARHLTIDDATEFDHDFAKERTVVEELLQKLKQQSEQIKKNIAPALVYCRATLDDLVAKFRKLQKANDKFLEDFNISVKRRADTAIQWAKSVLEYLSEAEEVSKALEGQDRTLSQLEAEIAWIVAKKAKFLTPEDLQKLDQLKAQRKEFVSEPTYVKLKSDLWKFSRVLPEYTVYQPEFFPLQGTAAQDVPVRSFDVDYKDLKLLHEGRNQVFKAIRAKDNEIVALKRYELSWSKDKSYLRKVCHLSSLVTHPNIVSLNGVASSIADEKQAESVYLESRFYAKGDLHEWLKSNKDLKKVAFVLQGVFRAVQSLHANGVLHRDLKPHNILIDENDNPAVGDLEITLETESTAFGTKGYIDPAVVAGTANWTSASDCYALGVIAGEALFGKRFVAPSDVPDSNSVPVEAIALVRGLLHPDPAQRLTAAQALQNRFVQ